MYDTINAIHLNQKQNASSVDLHLVNGLNEILSLTISSTVYILCHPSYLLSPPTQDLTLQALIPPLKLRPQIKYTPITLECGDSIRQLTNHSSSPSLSPWVICTPVPRNTKSPCMPTLQHGILSFISTPIMETLRQGHLMITNNKWKHPLIPINWLINCTHRWNRPSIFLVWLPPRIPQIKFSSRHTLWYPILYSTTTHVWSGAAVYLSIKPGPISKLIVTLLPKTYANINLLHNPQYNMVPTQTLNRTTQPLDRTGGSKKKMIQTWPT